ncbi:cold shock domain-containing protein [Streptomyces sp. NPDC029080]|uniref:cold-shock protein n=1 Tax=Streptomyces sp. NPDC029080 TaxID=3155017 RepID=UPI0033E4F270
MGRRTGSTATGVVKSCEANEGYGFLSDDEGGPDVFVHFADVRIPGSLHREDRVSYDVVCSASSPDHGSIDPRRRETLDVTVVEPELVVEVGVDVARDVSGRWRHPARLHRPLPRRRPPPGAVALTAAWTRRFRRRATG